MCSLDIFLEGSDWCEAAQWTGALTTIGRARFALLCVCDASPLSGEDSIALCRDRLERKKNTPCTVHNPDYMR